MTDEVNDDRDARYRRQAIALGLILLLLVLLLVAIGSFVWKIVAPAGSAKARANTTPGMTWVRSIYGWGPAANQQLNAPTSVSIGPRGTIWVGDEPRRFLVGFNPDGTFYKAVALKSRTATGPAPAPTSVFQAGNGEIYIVDQEAGHIFVCGEDGVVRRAWAVESPRDISVIGDRVYVSSAGTISVFSTDGRELFTIGTRGGEPEQFQSAHGMNVDAAGNLYVSDTLNARIKAYDKARKLLWIFPTYAQHVKRSASTLSGAPSRDASGNAALELPMGMTLDGAGRLVGVDAFKFEVKVMDPKKKGIVTATYGDFGSDDGKFAYPSDIAYDRDRDWFAIADTQNNRIQIVQIEGSGGDLLAPARRALTGPGWVCAIPLLALLLLTVLAVLRRRRRDDDHIEEDGPDEAENGDL